ncbi:MAG: heme-binding protein [Flavobacteriales bacterium]|nr:heme-binding protein [Flavobacteriales bacterium]
MKLTLMITGSIFAILLFTQFSIYKSSNKTEQYNYEVLHRFKSFEIRSYPKAIFASSVFPSSSFSNNANKGFRTIAGYIFGKNETNEQIAMTAPVIAHMKDSMKMSFVMPSAYSIDDLPKPQSAQVVVAEQEAMTVAVIRFGGYASDVDIQNHTRWLKNYLDQEGISYTDNVYYYGYNPPYQIFGRRNEVAIEVIFNN